MLEAGPFDAGEADTKPQLKKHANRYRTIILYLFFGSLAFLINLFTFTIFYRGFEIHELISNVLAWIITVIFAFFTNSIWVFHIRANTKKAFFKQMSAFFSGRIFTLVIEEAMLFALIELFRFNETAMKIFTQTIVMILNYWISKNRVFRQRN